MLSFSNDYIGHAPSERVTNFSGCDSEVLYQKNLKTKPIDWHYRTNIVTYNRNQNGHRCKEFEDVDLNNYILFTGCSHSEGIGLELENTYPYLVSKSQDCDYYNLGVGGTGIDVLAYNLITWFSKVKHKPKAVVIQWPDYTRFISKANHNTTDTDLLIANGSWSTRTGIDKFCVIGHDIGFFELRRTMMYNLIKNVIDCPIIEIAYDNAKFNDDTLLLLPAKQDLARDLIHCGILSNLSYASIITDIITDKYKHELKNN